MIITSAAKRGGGAAKSGPVPLMTPHPLVEAVRFTGEETRVERNIYVFVRSLQPTPFAPFAECIATGSVLKHHQAKSRHDVISDQPVQLHSKLLDCD
jgi:hypothetical protein